MADAACAPNIVLFITHDTGRFLSPYGIGTVNTPHAQRLAGEAVTFTRAFCTSPLCSPSRASCVTGLLPHQHGVNGLTAEAVGGFDLIDPQRHAAAHFRNAGYQTVLCGFEHETPHWNKAGFEQTISGRGGWFNGGGDLREHGQHIRRWLGDRDAARPFYMQIGCHETHMDWRDFATEPDESLGVTIPLYLRDLPEVRREMAEFQGAVRRLDQGLGDILDALDAAGVSDETIFVFTTDHGIDMPRAKGTCYDAGLEVFLFMRYPRGWAGDRRSDVMTSNLDVLPTLCEACGIAPPPGLPGRSLLPVLRDEPFKAHDDLFFEKTFHDTYDPTRAVRTSRYKYIRYFEVNIFQDLRLATETRRHYFIHDWRRRSVEELYDLEADPDETTNLAAEPGHRAALDDMRQRLLGWMRRTDDPLLRGPMTSPHYQRQLEAFVAGPASGTTRR